MLLITVLVITCYYYAFSVVIRPKLKAKGTGSLGTYSRDTLGICTGNGHSRVPLEEDPFRPSWQQMHRGELRPCR